MEFGLEGVQTLEVVELVDVFENVMQGAFDVGIFGLLAHT